MHAGGHGGAYGEDEPLLKCPPQHAEYAVSLRVVWQVRHPVCAWIPHSRVWMLLRLQTRREAVNNAYAAITFMARQLQVWVSFNHHAPIGWLVTDELTVY